MIYDLPKNIQSRKTTTKLSGDQSHLKKTWQPLPKKVDKKYKYNKLHWPTKYGIQSCGRSIQDME
jgi:hypothetical protein